MHRFHSIMQKCSGFLFLLVSSKQLVRRIRVLPYHPTILSLCTEFLLTRENQSDEERHFLTCVASCHKMHSSEIDRTLERVMLSAHLKEISPANIVREK